MTTTHYCHYVPAHGPHYWSCYENTPSKGEMLCLGWHARPDEYSTEANLEDLPEDRNFSTDWFSVSMRAVLGHVPTKDYQQRTGNRVV